MPNLISEIEATIEYHRRKLSFWEKALKEAQEENPQSQKTVHTAEVTLSHNGSTPRFGGFATRRQYIRDLVQRRPGLTTEEMRAKAKEEGISLTGSFPYEQLKVLGKEVKLLAGKYYPTEA